MGIKNLSKLINEYAPGVVKDIKDLEFFDLWHVGIDASISIYQLCSIGVKYNIKNKQGKYINHIQGIFFRTVKMILSGIHPTYIFDGRPPAHKAETIEQRKTARDRGASVRVPHEVFTEVAQLLKLMGVTTIQAPGEGEAQISLDIQAGYLDAISTSDYDALAFGAKYMIIGLDTAAKSVKLIDREQLLKELKLTHEQFIDVCILLGCDYTKTLPGIGYKRALNLIRKYGSIEAVLIGEGITAPKNFDYNSARDIFLNPDVSMIKYDPEIKKLNIEDIEKLREYLISVHGLEPSRVNKSLSALAKFHTDDTSPRVINYLI